MRSEQRQRLAKCVRIAAVLLIAGCAYALFCTRTGWGLPCPFHALTGLNCPGCGVSRMLLSLLRLDFSAAFQYNAVLLCLLPVLAVLGGIRLRHYLRFGSHGAGNALQAAERSLPALLVLWGAVRNVIGM